MPETGKDEFYYALTHVHVCILHLRGCLSPVRGSVLHSQEADIRLSHIDRKEPLPVYRCPVSCKIRSVQRKTVITIFPEVDLCVVIAPAVIPSAHLRRIYVFPVIGCTDCGLKESFVKTVIQYSDPSRPWRVVIPAVSAVIVKGDHDHRRCLIYDEMVRLSEVRMVARKICDACRKRVIPVFFKNDCAAERTVIGCPCAATLPAGDPGRSGNGEVYA